MRFFYFFLNFSWSQLCCSGSDEHDFMLFYEEKNSDKPSKLRDQSNALEESFELTTIFKMCRWVAKQVNKIDNIY